MNEEELKGRTKRFALEVIKLCEALSKNYRAEVLGKQVVRSATSVGANYRAACRGRSKPDFISKMGIVLEEADETQYWLELIQEAGLQAAESLTALAGEANQLTAIFTASLRTAKSNLQSKI